MKTHYFTLGFDHRHTFRGQELDKDCVIKITSYDPNMQMRIWFGDNWASEYAEAPNMAYFPRGVYDIENNRWENEQK